MNGMLLFRSRESGAKTGGGPLLIAAAVLACLFAAGPVAGQQSGTVTGVVSDVATGQLLESANVRLDDAPAGVITNETGRYVMPNVPAGSHTLTFEIIGYETLTVEIEVVAGETLERNAELTSGAVQVQELVVTGVARATPRAKLPFNVEKLDVAENPVPAVSAESFLVGKVPGIKVVRGGGQPGSTGDILLRGATSISGSQAPLIVVDGVITGNSMNDLASLDLESIEVIKGAAGASLYGSRAANGVVVIRTKRGAGFAGQDYSRMIARNEVGSDRMPGDIQLSEYHPWKIDPVTGFLVDVNGNPIPDITDTIAPRPALNGPDAATSFQDGEWPENKGVTLENGEVILEPFPLYDHVDRIYSPGRFMTNYFATEGRDGNTNYRASIERSLQGGVLPQWDDGFQRQGFRVNLDHKVRDYLNISVSSAYNHTKREDLGVNPFFDITFMGPYVDLLRRDSATADEAHCKELKDKGGCLIFDPDPLSNQTNPLFFFELRDYRDKAENVLASANVRWTPLSWFDLEGTFGFDKNAFRERNLQPALVETESGPPNDGFLTLTQSHRSRINADLTGSVSKAFGDFATRTRVRYLQQTSTYERFAASGNDFIAEGIWTFDNVEPDSYSATSTSQDIRSEGYYLISALDYQGKYIADAVVRKDGSSLFGEEERWHTYYRSAVAWRLSQEPWWSLGSVNEFKLHWAVGTAGRRPCFSCQYEIYDVGGGGIRPVRLGNKNLKPQRSTENEIGVDMVLMNRITAGLNYAQTTSEDQIIFVPLPKPGGFTEQVQNAGTLENNTWEFHIEGPVINTRDLAWNLRLNLDRTRQTITGLHLPAWRSGFFYHRVGEVYGAFYGARWMTSCDELPEGVPCDDFQVNDDGLLVWVDDANYDQGVVIPGEEYRWGTTSDTTYGTDVYEWGMPIQAFGWDGKHEDGCPTRREGDLGCSGFLYMGNSTPDLNVSLVSTFRWKGLTLYTLLDGEFGGTIYNRTRQWAYRENRSGDQDQFGKPEELKKPVKYYQVLYNTNNLSSWFVESGNYVKLREISLRYSLDPVWVDSLFRGRVTSLELNLIGRNLLTFTNYTGYDPEVGTSGDNNQNGGSDVIGRIDTYQYPNFRTISASLQFIF